MSALPTPVDDGASIDDVRRAFRDRLVEAGLLISTGVDGLYGTNHVYEAVLDAIDRNARALHLADGPTTVEFPPMIPRLLFDQLGYLRNFPQLVGAIYSFQGNDRAHAEILRRLDAGESVSELLAQSELTLTPACCYPVYPAAPKAIAGRSMFDLRGWCFRHEPSVDPMRRQAFRIREGVCLGTPEGVQQWRASWLQRIPQYFDDLGLRVIADVATDPFFGRAGRLMSMSQRELQLKIEFQIPVFGDEHPTACASVNYHQEHFGQLFDIRADHAEAHSACFGFGLERLTVAMFATHGLDPERWPSRVRDRLWP